MPFNCSSESSKNPSKSAQTNQQQQQYPIRLSNSLADESREHLLPNAQQQPISSLTRPGRPGSIAPSIISNASSIYSEASTTAGSPPGSYRGFPSREAYMEALEEFIESKMYMTTHSRTLTGFYGPETMEDVIASRPDVEFGWQRRRKARKAEKARRMTVTQGMEVLPEEDQDPAYVNSASASAGEIGIASQVVQRVETNDSQQTQTQGQSRMRRLSRVFSGGRRATVG